MSNNQTNIGERTFSVELKNVEALRCASISHSGSEVHFEGNLGSLICAGFLESMVLEIVGTWGTIRVDMSSGELEEKR